MITKAFLHHRHTLFYHTIALAVVALFVAPLFWVIGASLRQPGLPPPRMIEWLPDPINWANYRHIFELVPLASYTRNSLGVVALAVPITLITASWAGFALALLPARLGRILVISAIVLRMVPGTALWLPRFLLFKQLMVLDTFWVLILPAFMGTSPFLVLLFYWAFRRIPRELFESARLDGAGILAIWARIAMPLVQSTIMAVAVLCFTDYWSDFISPLLYLKSETLYTLPIGLRILQQLDRTNWPILMAAAVFITIPVIMMFLVIQHFFWPENGLITGR